MLRMTRPLLLLLTFAFLLSIPMCADAERIRAGQGTIKEVIKLLEKMLEKNEEEVKADREMFAKFKCYCDSNEAEKKASIEKLNNEITLAEAKLQDLQASSAKLSVDVADLQKQMAANEFSREQAIKMRQQAHENFLQEESDMVAAIASMDAAIGVLSSLSAEGLKKGAAFMIQAQAPGKEKKDQHSIAVEHVVPEDVRKKSHVLLVVRRMVPLLPALERTQIEALLQGGSEDYLFGTEAVSKKEDPKGIAGILQSMRDTFEKSMKTAKEAEEAAAEAHEKFLETKEEEHGVMKESHEGKEGKLGENDESLGSTQEQLDTASGTLEEDQKFLDELLANCREKSELYEKRKALCADEQAAISEAIAILNSDAAFETFGKVEAAKKGRGGGAASFFLQLRSSSSISSIAAKMQTSANSLGSARLGEVARAILDAGKNNPLDKVLTMIDDVIVLIEKEEKADDDNKEWCDKEMGINEEMLEAKTTAIEDLEAEITTLKEDIEETKSTIADVEASLEENRASQAELKKTRDEEHAVFLETMKNTGDATDVLQKAIKALKRFYADKAKAELMARREEVRLGLAIPEGGAKMQKQSANAPDAVEETLKMGLLRILDGAKTGAKRQGAKNKQEPEIFEDAEVKQSESGGKVIEMLEFILKETETQEMDARDAEEKAKEEYDTEMEELKTSEEALLSDLGEAKNTLAEHEETLAEKKLDLEKTEKDKAAIEKYIAKMKPGCDFITENIEERKKKRAEETKALEEAKEKIKGTPVYKKFEEEAAEKSL